MSGPFADLSFLPLLAPALVLAAALTGLMRPAWRNAPGWIEAAAMAGMAVAVLSALALAVGGARTSPLIGAAGVGFSARLDLVSVTMLLLVSFIGWVVLRYARSYMAADPRRNAFIGWTAGTLAAVLLVVQAGNLTQLVVAWIAMSLSLRQLLLFNSTRPGARRAARKHFIAARVGDAALLGAAALLWWRAGASDIATILASEAVADAAPHAAALLALAAILKSAQAPTHGWLTEVMEAPTPVSALLHAGVVNAGGFLLIRFADVMVAAPGVLAALAIVGGFTALFGGVVMLTQSAVKTSLAWSTISQMGFMILQCGFALFPLALLHIVAHSLYKAHAFLASGGAVALIAANRRPGPVAIPNMAAVAKAFGLAIGVFIVIAALFAAMFGFDGKSPQAVALGAILIFGVAYLFAQGLADEAPRELTINISVFAGAASLSYFALQTGAEALMSGALPTTPPPGPLEWALIALAVFGFGVVSTAQAMLPLWAHHPAAAGLRVHLANGLYLNALVDRALRAWATPSERVAGQKPTPSAS